MVVPGVVRPMAVGRRKSSHPAPLAQAQSDASWSPSNLAEVGSRGRWRATPPITDVGCSSVPLNHAELSGAIETGRPKAANPTRHSPGLGVIANRYYGPFIESSWRDQRRAGRQGDDPTSLLPAAKWQRSSAVRRPRRGAGMSRRRCRARPASGGWSCPGGRARTGSRAPR